MTEPRILPPGTMPGIWVVEQIENGIASIEMNGTRTATVPVTILPRGTAEGDVMRVKASSASGTQVTITLDPAEKARRIAQSAAQVAKGGPGGKGNIVL